MVYTDLLVFFYLKKPNNVNAYAMASSFQKPKKFQCTVQETSYATRYHNEILLQSELYNLSSFLLTKYGIS